jgi:hypothetical protein
MSDERKFKRFPFLSSAGEPLANMTLEGVLLRYIEKGKVA